MWITTDENPFQATPMCLARVGNLKAQLPCSKGEATLNNSKNGYKENWSWHRVS
jgi:hypothetical protein